MMIDVVEVFKNNYSYKMIENKEYQSFKISGLKFNCEAYELEGFGRLSIMNAKGMMGLMKMNSIIFNPFEVDLPLLSIDRIKAFGNDSLYLEMYNTCLSDFVDEKDFYIIKDKYKELNDVIQKSHWYDDIEYKCSIVKKVKKNNSALIDECINDYINLYLALAKKAEKCDFEAKKAKAKTYSDGLLNNGGPATDAFLKTWGKDKTKDFFDKVLFG